jgi:hypothetical protein
MNRRVRRLVADRQRRWRQRARGWVLDALGHFCHGCGANGSTPLEIAHRFPLAHSSAPRHRSGRGMDRTVREARANPFLFALYCRPCHVERDGFRLDLRP